MAKIRAPAAWPDGPCEELMTAGTDGKAGSCSLVPATIPPKRPNSDTKWSEKNIRKAAELGVVAAAVIFQVHLTTPCPRQRCVVVWFPVARSARSARREAWRIGCAANMYLPR